MDAKQAEFERKEMERKKSEFNNALEKIVPNLKKEIEVTNAICKTIKELKNGMGQKFEVMNPTNFYYGVRLYLFKKGIYVEVAKKDKEPALQMRFVNEDDKLFKNSKNSEDEEVAEAIMTVMIFARPLGTLRAFRPSEVLQNT